MTGTGRIAQGLKTFMARFAHARRGNVAMIFALSLPVLVMMTLGGVDLHRASTVRVNLQDALDAAALAAARSPYTTNAEIRTVGLNALKANLKAYPQITLREDQTTFVLNAEGVVVADAKVDVNAIVANVLLPPYGKFMDDKLPVGAHSEVFRSNKMVEIALVLDNTGSMSGTKLSNTKTAARDLIDRLAAADARSVEPDAVKIALVPFSMTVRVMSGLSTSDGVSNSKRPSWLSNTQNHTGNELVSGQKRFNLFNSLSTGWGGCIESRPYPNDVRDTAPSSSDEATMFVPYFAADEPDLDDYPNDDDWEDYYPSNRNGPYERNNYVNDGINGSNANNGGFSNSTQRADMWRTRRTRGSKYNSATSGLDTDFGPNQGCDLEPVMRLTDDFNALKSAVSRMKATGNTNIPMGLMWGWHALSPNAPFSDGQPYGTERLQKIIILMTDGENVNSTTDDPDDSTYSGVGFIWQNRLGVGAGSTGTERRNAMDDRLEELCENLAGRDIVVYTVGVQVDERTQELLSACASAPANYFNVTSASAIGAAFDRIAGAIENLRISK